MNNKILNRIFLISLLLAIFTVLVIEPLIVKGEDFSVTYEAEDQVTVTNVKFVQDNHGLKQIISVDYDYNMSEDLWAYVTKPFEVRKGDKIYAVSKENLQLVSIIK